MRHPPGAGPLGIAVAWLGGGVFVGSLAFFVWSYGVRFGQVGSAALEPGALARPVAVNLGLFGIFALHHSVMARSGAKEWLVQRVPAALERSLYVWVGSLLFVATCALWQQVPGVLYTIEWPARGLFHALQLAGGWLTVRGAGVIDPLELAGIRQAHGDWRAPAFRVVGPYRLVRHPIYLGWILLTFGMPSMTATRFSFAVISAAYLALAVPLEERSLVHAFGEAYQQYRRRVRWRMVPFLY